MQVASLPEDIELLFAQLSHEGWRERKEAIERMSALVRRRRRDISLMANLAERLLDGMLEPDELRGRASCLDVLVEMREACIDPLLRRLSSRGSGTRLLVDLLGQIGDESHVDLVVGILRDAEADANLRASAATALGTIGGTKAIVALQDLLSSDSDMLRTYALDAFQTAGAVVPVTLLAPLLARPVTRKGAAALLGYTESIDALPLLVPLLVDVMAGVRAVTAIAIVRLGAGLAKIGKPRLVEAAMRDCSAPTRVRIRELIGHRDREVRLAAIQLASMAADAQALPLVLPVMDDPLTQEQALAMVTKLGAAASAALVPMIGESDIGHREHLCRLIGALPGEDLDPALLAMLMEALDEGSDETRCASAEALRFVGGRTAMGALYRAMAESGRVGEEAADALAEVALRVGGSRHDELSLIIGASWPQQGDLARNLCRVVGKIGAVDFVPHLVSMLGSTDVGTRIGAAQALGQIPGEHEGVSGLTFALADEEPQVRAAACRSLGHIQAPQSCQSLLGATTDPSPLVRAAAVQALVALDNPVALARFREIIVDDPVPTVVVQAIAGIGASQLEQDLSMLMSLGTSEDHEVVKAAARALKNFSLHRATAALLGLLNHERWDVRRAAAEVLAERNDPTALGPLREVFEREDDELVAQVLQDTIRRLEHNEEVGVSQ